MDSCSKCSAPVPAAERLLVLSSLPQAPACTARKTLRETTASSARWASTEAPILPTPAIAARAPLWHRPAPAEYVRLSFWSRSSDNECSSFQLNCHSEYISLARWFIVRECPVCENQGALLEPVPATMHLWCLCCLL